MGVRGPRSWLKMRVKTFWAINVQLLEIDINDFIKGRDVQQIGMDLKDIPYAWVVYDETKRKKRAKIG